MSTSGVTANHRQRLLSRHAPLAHLCARSRRSRAAQTANAAQEHPELAGGGCDTQHLVTNSAGISAFFPPVSTNFDGIGAAATILTVFLLIVPSADPLARE